MVVEMMGRSTGWIALHAGVAGSADVVLIPEIPFDLESVCEAIRSRDRMGRRYSIVVAAEGAAPLGARTGKETRSIVLGHLQRGGGPTSFDRLMALRFGTAAVRALADGLSDVMVALRPPAVLAVPLSEAVAGRRAVPLDGDTIATAQSLGICLGAPAV
jgi:6-phosphofructokinase 1